MLARQNCESSRAGPRSRPGSAQEIPPEAVGALRARQEVREVLDHELLNIGPDLGVRSLGLVEITGVRRIWCRQGVAEVGDRAGPVVLGPPLDLDELGHRRPRIEGLDVAGHGRPRCRPTERGLVVAEPELHDLGGDTAQTVDHRPPLRPVLEQVTADMSRHRGRDGEHDVVEVDAASQLDQLGVGPCAPERLEVVFVDVIGADDLAGIDAEAKQGSSFTRTSGSY